MERIYYIDHIKTEDINALSLKLNSMQEVSRIKINKDSISVREGVSISMKKGKQNIRSKVPKKPYIVENLYWMRSQNKI